MESEFRHGRHSVTNLKFHFICVTKYRRKVFTTEGLDLLERSIQSSTQKAGIVLLEFNGEADHIHVLLEVPPTLSISKVANILKGTSSREYAKSGLAMPSKKHLWSPSYFCASVGGAPLERLKEYIQQQNRPK